MRTADRPDPAAGSRRRANPRGQGGRLRDELLDAATRLLQVGGRDARLTLRGVAREAGVAAPSVYQHFTDLDALMLELIRRHLADLGAAVLDAVRGGAGLGPDADAPDLPAPVSGSGSPSDAAPSEGDPAAGRLVAAARAYVRWGLEHPGPYLVVIEGRALRQLTSEEEGAPAGDGLLDLLVGLLTDLRHPPADPAVTAVALWTALHGVVALRTAKPSFPWPPLERHIDAVLAAALADVRSP